MPLSEGRSWSYLVPQASKVMTLKVAGRAYVGKSPGWVLLGEGGRNKVAWSGGELMASEFSAMRFDPPIVVLKPGREDAVWPYKGVCESRMWSGSVTGTVRQQREKIEVSGLERQTLLTTLELVFRGKKIELKTWYERSVGVIRQEQRNDGALVSSLVLLSGK